MIRPGVNVNVRTAPAPGGPPTDTGVWFVAGITERGPVDAPRLVRNMGDLEATYGTRQAWSTVLYDSLDEVFHEGANKVYVQRDVGPGATKGTLVLMDGGAGAGAATLTVTAKDPGAASTQITVQVTHPDANSFELLVSVNGVLQERSGTLTTPAAAVVWSAASNWVTVTDNASAAVAPANNPRVLAATALSAGNDDRGSITDTVRTATLAKIPAALGPGQVSYPGATTDAIHIALLEHAKNNNRTALLDLPDTGVVADMTASVLAARGATEPERGGAFGPQVIIPGLTANTTRTVPASALVAGLLARNDGTNGTDSPAAGSRGQSAYAIGVTHQFTDTDRQTANDGGVNIIRPLFGPITLYGYRTCSALDIWRSLSDQRLRMEIVNLAEIIGEEFMFAVIDGQGHTIASFGGALTGMLAGFYNRGALYGATSDQAFSVNVGDAVNTVTTIANGELHAVIGLRMSPFAEMIVVEIVKTPITQSV